MQHYSEVYKLWKLGNLTLGYSDEPDQIKRFANHNPEFFLVGMLNDQIIGVVMGGFDGRRGYVHHLVVHPKYRRQGYGIALMQELIQRFRRNKIEKLHLFVERRNAVVISFYEKLGWKIRSDLEMLSYVLLSA
ncbi:MAG: GNAT family N-acetyltransferase [Promethearchaeota archaeon]